MSNSLQFMQILVLKSDLGQEVLTLLHHFPDIQASALVPLKLKHETVSAVSRKMPSHNCMTFFQIESHIEDFN